MFRCLLLALLGCPTALAQPLPPLVTDRPDFTESGVVVPLGHVQVEAGVSLVGSGPVDAFNGPELLVRWAPLRRVELRFGGPDYLDVEGATGFGDPSFGVKVQLGPVAGWDVGVIAAASLPLGDDAFSSGTVDPELILAAAHSFGERYSLGGQVAVARAVDFEEWVWSSTYVLGAELNARWGLFQELAVVVPEARLAEVLHHSGATYALTPNVQLDAHVGIGLTDAAPDTILGLGISVRR
jgi:hypothetical protein